MTFETPSYITPDRMIEVPAGLRRRFGLRDPAPARVVFRQLGRALGVRPPYYTEETVLDSDPPRVVRAYGPADGEDDVEIGTWLRISVLWKSIDLLESLVGGAFPTDENFAATVGAELGEYHFSELPDLVGIFNAAKRPFRPAVRVPADVDVALRDLLTLEWVDRLKKASVQPAKDRQAAAERERLEARAERRKLRQSSGRLGAA